VVDIFLGACLRLGVIIASESSDGLMQSNNKKKQNKKIWATSRESRDLQWLLRESLDLQNNQKVYV